MQTICEQDDKAGEIWQQWFNLVFNDMLHVFNHFTNSCRYIYFGYFFMFKSKKLCYFYQLFFINTF